MRAWRRNVLTSSLILHPSSLSLLRLMKIGLFGGTFDPIHWGHLRSAEEVSETFGFGSRLLHSRRLCRRINAGQTTTACARPIADGPSGCGEKSHDSACRRSRCRAWEFPIPSTRSASSRPTKRQGDSLYFIIGLDAFREIGTWKDFAEIFPLCNFIVTSRPGSKDNDPLRGTGVAVKKLFCYDFKQEELPASERHADFFYRAYGHRDFSFGDPRIGQARQIDSLSGAFGSGKIHQTPRSL